MHLWRANKFYRDTPTNAQTKRFDAKSVGIPSGGMSIELRTTELSAPPEECLPFHSNQPVIQDWSRLLFINRKTNKFPATGRPVEDGYNLWRWSWLLLNNTPNGLLWSAAEREWAQGHSFKWEKVPKATRWVIGNLLVINNRWFIWWWQGRSKDFNSNELILFEGFAVGIHDSFGGCIVLSWPVIGYRPLYNADQCYLLWTACWSWALRGTKQTRLIVFLETVCTHTIQISIHWQREWRFDDDHLQMSSVQLRSCFSISFVEGGRGVGRSACAIIFCRRGREPDRQISFLIKFLFIFLIKQINKGLPSYAGKGSVIRIVGWPGTG